MIRIISLLGVLGQSTVIITNNGSIGRNQVSEVIVDTVDKTRVKVLNLRIWYRWLSFSADDDIRKAISALVRLSFDVRLRCISSDLELAIGSLLDAIDGSQWTAQVS